MQLENHIDICLIFQERGKQEQIVLDMKILEKILEDTQNQAVDDLNKTVCWGERSLSLTGTER